MHVGTHTIFSCLSPPASRSQDVSRSLPLPSSLHSKFSVFLCLFEFTPQARAWHHWYLHIRHVWPCLQLPPVEVHVCMHACMHACMRACERASERASVRASVQMHKACREGEKACARAISSSRSKERAKNTKRTTTETEKIIASGCARSALALKPPIIA